MVARINTVAFQGIDTLAVDVQMTIANDLIAVEGRDTNSIECGARGWQETGRAPHALRRRAARRRLSVIG